ncbi:MAG: hypothetical protein F6J87_26710 [Spirulina sp. SIO3F2]|nr:hypothetical protein [Spirulina sp. SIO3F2]
MDKQQLLAQTMAFLMCTTPDTPLGKLLNFCLATKVIAGEGNKTSLELAEALLDNPDTLLDWLAEVIDSDSNYSQTELRAVLDLPLKTEGNNQAFMAGVFAELEGLEGLF